LKATTITLTNITIIGYCYLCFIHVNFSFNYPFLLLPLDASSNSLAMHPRFYSKILPLRGPTKETWKDDLLSNESRNLDSLMEIPSLEKFDDKIDTSNNNNNNNNNLIIYKLLHDAHLIRRHRASQEKIQGSPTSSFSISMNCNTSNIPCYKPIVMHFYLDMISYTDHVGSDSLSFSLFYMN